jgi:hypothetical protein
MCAGMRASPPGIVLPALRIPEGAMGGKNTKDRKNGTGNDILEQIFRVKNELALAYRVFDQASSSEMVDSCIYHINSLQATYAHYLRQAKERGAAEEPFFCRGRENAI